MGGENRPLVGLRFCQGRLIKLSYSSISPLRLVMVSHLSVFVDAVKRGKAGLTIIHRGMSTTIDLRSVPVHTRGKILVALYLVWNAMTDEEAGRGLTQGGMIRTW